jgi:hypothetical protein
LNYLLEIAFDLWLEEHFQETSMNVESNDFIFENPYQELDIIHVTSKHPTYDFQIGNLVAVESGGQDPFWLAHITKVDEDSLKVVYFHHSPFRS